MVMFDQKTLAAYKRVVADDIREAGWMLVCHQDYRTESDIRYTSWVFARGKRCVEGRGRCDAEALNEVRLALRLPLAVARDKVPMTWMP